jgi:DNA-directed RNA polymerase subunit RPC12/RpoP
MSCEHLNRYEQTCYEVASKGKYKYYICRDCGHRIFPDLPTDMNPYIDAVLAAYGDEDLCE